jgi:hypothetical protein
VVIAFFISIKIRLSSSLFLVMINKIEKSSLFRNEILSFPTIWVKALQQKRGEKPWKMKK